MAVVGLLRASGVDGVDTRKLLDPGWEIYKGTSDAIVVAET